MNERPAEREVLHHKVMPEFKGAVAALLREAGVKFILPRFENLRDADISTKSSDTDFVTIADREAEAWLTPRLAGLLPATVVGEEAVSSQQHPYAFDATGYSWTVDPLDGTKNFVRGKPAFCCMIALLWAGKAVQSWIWHPLSETLFFAAAAGGAWRIDSEGAIKITVDRQPKALEGMIGTGNALGLPEPRRSNLQARLRLLAGREFNGSAGVQACRIASGQADFMIHGRATPWDHAPTDLLCREAGGHAAALDDEAPFDLNLAAPFMAASSPTTWAVLRQAVWD